MTSEKMTGYASIDKPWLKYYPEGSDNIVPMEESMYQMLRRLNKERLDSVVIELRTNNNSYSDGIKITYEQFFTRIEESAKSFAKLGVEVDEIVPLILPNIPESRIFIYALNYIGATAYPVSPMLATVNFEQILSENSIRTIVIFSGFWDKFADNITKSNVDNIIFISGFESTPIGVRMLSKISGKMSMPKVSADKNVMSWADFNAVGKKYLNHISPYYNKDHIAVIVGTSGTTGISKGVCLTDEALNASAIGQQIGAKYIPGEKALDILIQSISYGLAAMHCFACFACHTVIIPELVTDRIAQIICKVKPDCFPGGPVHFNNICSSEEFAKGEIQSIRCGFSGGATLEKDVERLLNKITDEKNVEDTNSIFVRQGYGSTECCGVASANFNGAYKFGSIGIPMSNTVLGIFKPGTDIECKYGEEGEICVCGPTVMKEYLNNPSETDNVLRQHSDGRKWLHQFDLGWCDSDGHFYLTDRIKNIFMRTGFNVHPSKIAEFINSINGVNECSVVGVPHPDEQMVPVAFVVLNQKIFTSVDLARQVLNKECIKNLAETDIPYEWVFVKDLPRNMGGKIDNQELIKTYKINYMK